MIKEIKNFKQSDGFRILFYRTNVPLISETNV